MITLTREALAVLTPEQLSRIQMLVGEDRSIVVTRDFSLPDGWIYFVIDGKLHGGISPEGEAHT